VWLLLQRPSKFHFFTRSLGTRNNAKCIRPLQFGHVVTMPFLWPLWRARTFPESFRKVLSSSLHESYIKEERRHREGGEMPFARLFSCATSIWATFYLRAISIARPPNCATFQLCDVPIARHFSSATTQLRDILIARHFNCATFQLRDIPSARHPSCATSHLRDFSIARHLICATIHLRDFFPSCLGPLLVSLG